MSAYIKPNTAGFRRFTGGFGPPVGVVVQNLEADTAGLSPGDHTKPTPTRPDPRSTAAVPAVAL
jgi:hypothetical protein